MRSRDVLSTNLDHTGTGAFSVREQNAEVEVMREDYRLIRPCPPQNFIISGVRLAYLRPMHGIKPLLPKQGNPFRRQIHVNQEPHAAPRGTSSSSARQAA